MATTLATTSDQLVDIIRRLPMLEALRGDVLRRAEVERRLDLSSATYYRYTNWLSDEGLVEESNEGITLTSTGEVVTEEASRFETTVLTTLGGSEPDRDLLLDIINHAPGLEAVATSPRTRRELERELDVSRTTSYRFTRSFETVGAMEKSDGTYALTAAGEEVVAAVDAFETTVRAALRLAPVLEAVGDTTPPFDLDAFADATVTTTGHGDAHSPVNRAIGLIQETDSLRAVDINSIAPLYLNDLQQRIVDGMETDNIMMPEVVANILSENPEKCIEACESGYVTIYLHDDLSYGLVILDDRVGIGIRGEDSRTLQMFIDTDSPDAREWAEAVFESYRADAVRMEGFTPWKFRRAMERGSFEVAEPIDR